ncbi:amidohydrolase family protein [Bacillaceae bacterium]
MYDLHTHFIPENVLTWLKENAKAVDARWEKKDPAKAEFLVVNQKWGFELKKAFFDPALYLAEQKGAGVLHSLVSPIPQLFLYEFPADITRELAQVYNQSLADWIHVHPERLSALATVPLQNPEQAAEELKRALALGLKGAIIGPGCNGYMLTDDFFAPFWEEANRQRAIIFIHPLLCEDPRLKRKMMPNLIGVPWETTVCATDILLNGLLDRYPEVKILLAHGGGFLPYQIGRLTKGCEQWKQAASSLQAPPLEYLKRFWYDAVLWHPAAVTYLIDLVGEERVVPGSDYPFDLSVWPPVSSSDRGVKSLLGI